MTLLQISIFVVTYLPFILANFSNSFFFFFSRLEFHQFLRLRCFKCNVFLKKCVPISSVDSLMTYCTWMNDWLERGIPVFISNNASFCYYPFIRWQIKQRAWYWNINKIEVYGFGWHSNSVFLWKMLNSAFIKVITRINFWLEILYGITFFMSNLHLIHISNALTNDNKILQISVNWVGIDFIYANKAKLFG